MAHLIEVAFRGNRKEFFQWEGETAPPLHAGVIVEADRGEDYGRVHSTGELAEVRCKGCAHGCGTTPPPRVALRLSTPDDDARDALLPAENESARRRAMERVKANNLVMKVTDAEWQWDRRKLTFFFTAERRVDFRTLVRDLAAMFRARIELKQIGVRDEAKRLSGIGRCGREYCSASWLPDLRPVNLGVAKDQKLSLNPQQISGACGRLMCCLRYEHEFYVQSRRRFPKEGRILVTSIGEEKVISCDIFHDRVTLRSAEGDTRVVPLAELRDEIGGFGDTSQHDRASSASDHDDDTGDAVLDHRDQDLAHSTRAVSAAPVATKPVLSATRSVVPPVKRSNVEPALPIAVERQVAEETRSPSVDTSRSVGVVAHEISLASNANAVSDARGDARGEAPAEANTGASNAVSGVAGAEATSEASSDSSSDASGDSATDGEGRRKRRRGRRGGRRLRAAEQRRQEGASTTSHDGANGISDDEARDDAHDDNGDEPDDASSDTPPGR